MDTKPLFWVGSTRDDIRAMPADVRGELGFDLRRIQRGEFPRDWKPLGSVGAGVVEIRVNVKGAFRLMYIAKYAEGIYVLHVFQKKTRKTANFHIALARSRLAAVRRLRKEEYER